MLELILAIFENIRRLAIGYVIIALIALFILGISYAAAFEDESKQKIVDFIKSASVFKWILGISLSLCIVPSVDDLWHVRIGLVKYHLASPENLSKGAEEIARIAHELECKYLTCQEKKHESSK